VPQPVHAAWWQRFTLAPAPALACLARPPVVRTRPSLAEGSSQLRLRCRSSQAKLLV